MIINNISIDSFGLFQNYKEEFGPGINIVLGANETGKSTLAAFIKYMFFGFGESKVGVLSEREKRISWKTGEAAGSMVITLNDGKQYKIERKTTRVPSSGEPVYREHSALIDLSSQKPVPTDDIGLFLFNIDRDFFEATAFLGQLQVHDDPDKDFLQAIDNLMFSGNEEENAQQAVKNLKEIQKSLLSEDGRDGKIVEVKSRIQALSARLSASLRGQQEIFSQKKVVNEIDQNRKDAQNSLDKTKELKNGYKNYVILQSFERLHEEEQEVSDLYDQLQNHRSENSFNGFYPTVEYAKDFETKKGIYLEKESQFVKYSQELNDLQNEEIFTHDIEKCMQRADKHGGAKQVMAEQKLLHNATQKFMALMIITGVLGFLGFLFEIVGIAMGIMTTILHILTLSLSSVCLVAFIVFLCVFMKKYELEKSYCVDYGAKDGKELIERMMLIERTKKHSEEHLIQLGITRESFEKSRTEYLSAKGVLEENLVIWGKILPENEDSGSFLDIFEGAVLNFLKRERELINHRDEVQKSVDSLKNFLCNFSESEIRASLPLDMLEVLKGTTSEKLEESITYYEEQLAYHTTSYKTEVDKLNLGLSHVENPTEIIELRNAAEQELEVLEKRNKAIVTAIIALSGADKRLRAELAPKLAQYSQQLMSMMTSSKYTTLSVGEDLHLHLDIEGVERSVDVLSGGTRDMAYLALRLSLIRLLYKETPPVTLDESFTHQDNDRSVELFRVLAGLSKQDQMQTFIYTCRSREESIANEYGIENKLITLI